MKALPCEVADVLERNSEQLSKICSASWQSRTLHALRKCRTAALGGHIDRCDNAGCNRLHLSYNSCRNRHCPKCQGHKREAWIRAREAELLNTPYFYVVFTLPDTLNRLCLYAPKELYGLLFKTAWSVIRDFGRNPKFMGAATGMVAILHTWGQNLGLHPHLHCIVPGGGITGSGKWRYANNRGGTRYLFPVRAMGKVFRARFVAGLRKLFDLPAGLYDTLFAKDWVVYCKRPFHGPSQVIEYLGRYTHKIAIGNHRIKDLDRGGVAFSVKDYRHGGKKSLLQLSDGEFIRRFALHILPKGFVRMRHYGILSSSKKKKLLPRIKAQIGDVRATVDRGPLQHKICPVCRTGHLATVMVFDNRGPPKHWLKKLEQQNVPSEHETVNSL